MLMNAPKVGGASREVLFRLGVLADPAAAAQFKRFGDQIIGEQGRISAAAKQHAARMSADWKSAGSEQVAQLDRVAKAAEASATRVGEAFRRAGREATTAVTSIPSATMGSRAAAAGRVGGASAGVARAGGGGNIGEGINSLATGVAQSIRFAGMSGLVGEQDSQKILETLIKIELLVAGIHGATALGKGVGSLSGAAGLAPMLPMITAAAAAVLGTAAAVAAGIEFAGAVSQNGVGGGSAPGGYLDWMGSKYAKAGAWIQTKTRGDLGSMPVAGENFEVGLARSERDVGRQQAGIARAREQQGMRQQDQQVVADFQARTRDTLKEQLDLQRKARMESLEGAKERLGLVKEELSEAKSILRTRREEAEEAKKRFQGDLEKFADLDPLERSRLARIKGKVTRGQDLSADESRLAGGFSEFEDAARRSNINRGLAAGGGAIFTSGARSAADAARMATEAAAAVSRAEVTVKRQENIVVSFQQDTQQEQQLSKAIKYIEGELRKRLDAQQTSIDEVKAAMLRLELDRRRGIR